MNVYISYFNNIRNMNYHCIPISTAMYDPKWYHENSYDKSHTFLDKRFVINGLRCESLVFNIHEYNKLVASKQECSRDCKQIPGECAFMKKYREQLDRLYPQDVMDFFYRVRDYVRDFWSMNNSINKLEDDNKDYDIVLLVHEKPDIKCAERPVLQDWFLKNLFIELKEWEVPQDGTKR